MDKIYTRKGDKGTTGTFLGRMSKSNELAEVLGSIDELNSWCGLYRESIYNLKFKILNQYSSSKFSINKTDAELKRIQGNLMEIAALMAGSSDVKLKKHSFTSETKHLEKLIDKLTIDLPKLSNFIYPMGEMQVVRAVARKVERKLAGYFFSTPPESPPKLGGDHRGSILKYLNRLSDALFILARWENFRKGIKEEVWKG